jgi:hypothetical protein
MAPNCSPGKRRLEYSRRTLSTRTPTSFPSPHRGAILSTHRAVQTVSPTMIGLAIGKSTPQGFYSKAQGSATGRQTCRRTLGGIVINTPTLKGLHLRNVRPISADFADDADKTEEYLKHIKRFAGCESERDLFFSICEICDICGCLLLGLRTPNSVQPFQGRFVLCDAYPGYDSVSGDTPSNPGLWSSTLSA